MEETFFIGVDARPLAFPGTGNGRYLHRMLQQLTRLQPDCEWILFTHRTIDNEYADLLLEKSISLQVDRTPFSRLGPLWIHLRIPGLLEKYDCDLFWATLAMLPLCYRRRSESRAMVNFHDLNAYRAPQTMVFWNRWQHRLTNGRTLRAAERILCLSACTREDIRRQFPEIPPDRLQVIYPGCELPAVTPLSPGGAVGGLDNFILCVGSLEPRKNHQTLIDGYRQARRERSDLPPLLIVGRKGWGDSSLYRLLRSGSLTDEGIHYLENASDSHLRWCYEKAAFLAFPSIHEGFGLPVLEARQLGKPLLISDIPVFREIVREEEAFVAPTDVEKWREALLSFTDRLRSGKLEPPPFDENFWSWRERAAELSRIITELREGPAGGITRSGGDISGH